MAEKAGPAAQKKSARTRNHKAMKLDGTLGMREAETVRRDLAQAIGGGSARIDVRELTTVDTSIVQLLIAATRSAAEQGGRVEIVGFDGGILSAFMHSIGVSAKEINVAA
ncbi:STAS domain-containing protein [Phaeovulum sp.]|uniref:STAS domain-containing protein n=1 Tax=Phaeovulum sp. TaxID=2934796 RepID=UPI0035679451